MFAYGPADATAIPKPPLSLASFKSRLVLPFWYRLTQVVLEETVVVIVVLRVGLIVSMIHILLSHVEATLAVEVMYSQNSRSCCTPC